MATDNTILLNRVFTRNTLREIVDESYSDVFITAIRKYIADPLGKSNRQLFSELYAILKKQYRNEYYYKNTILNKLLLGVHKPTTTSALTEVSIGKSKADFVLINGQAVVYEIKTELDNLDRLDSQISNYFYAFSRVSVLASEEYLDKLQERLNNSPVGISVLTRRGTISEKKRALEYTDRLNKDIMFRILRKSEYEEIIVKHYGKLPEVTQFDYYRVCKSLFCKLETNEAYNEFVSILKKRGKIELEYYQSVPYELKFLAYFSGFRSDEYKKLQSFLDQKEVFLCTSHF